MNPDLYEILGVDKSASQTEIKSAYRKLALENHPDQNPDDPGAEERFKQIAQAYEILGDPQKRRAYDQFGTTGGPGASPFGAGGPGAAGFQEFGDFFDFFSSVFGGGGASRGPRAERGRDFRREIEISYQEAAFGGSKTLTIPAFETCDDCAGGGAAPGTFVEVCPQCDGRGTIRIQQGFFALQRECPQCDGSGRYIPTPCSGCDGRGVQTVEETIEVRIPASIDEGQVLIVQGKGEPGQNGGPAGDLKLIVRLEEHPLFDRDGQDLHCHVPISFTQAALGGKVEVPTLEGKVVMKIPAGTQSGKIFRLRKKGFPLREDGPRGDQLVQVAVETPVELNERQRELLEEFARVSGEEVHPEKRGFFSRMKELFD